jgi:transposase InsO family protein
MVAAINESIAQGLTQKEACKTIGLSPRKFRRWANPKPHKQRTAWNKLRNEERDAIEAAAWLPDLIGRPVSHVFVHGHDSGKFFASLSTVHRVLKAKNLVQPLERKRPTTSYVSAHALMDDGFSLLCYDGTLFKTDAGIGVWAIPVMILPQRYLLSIGHTISGVSASDLNRVLREAYAFLPQHMLDKLLAHSDRGSAMKARVTKNLIKELLGAPVHFGRPHTPDDEGWIEALIKNLKYHREAPQSFKIVDDVLRWLSRFPDIYNNDPHSSLSYVTPLQALQGLKEVILTQRKQNLEAARALRYTAWQERNALPFQARSIVIGQPV